MTGSTPTARDIEDDGLPPDLSFEAARAAQIAHWAATTPDQRLAWLAEAQRFAHRAGALPRIRPAADLEGWDQPPLSTPVSGWAAARRAPGGGCRGGTP